VDIQADNTIDRGSIAQTERLIRPHVRRTPVIEVDAADFGLAAASLSFKLELLQHAGSFKTRGAFANLLTREIPQAGVVAASGGNHGAAVAYASRLVLSGVRTRSHAKLTALVLPPLRRIPTCSPGRGL
jgi:threonine dehydratase